MAIFTTSRENSSSSEISHFPVSKQTVKVQFSLDVLGEIFFSTRLVKIVLSLVSLVGKNNVFHLWGRSDCQFMRLQHSPSAHATNFTFADNCLFSLLVKRIDILSSIFPLDILVFPLFYEINLKIVHTAHF